MFASKAIRYLLLSIICLFFSATLPAQLVLKGKVTDAVTHEPIASANVFLSGTSIGAVTNTKGEFVFPRFPSGRFELVVSCIGYDFSVNYISSAELPDLLSVSMIPKINELQEVIVEPYDKNGWEKWGQFFIDNFIGNSLFANECRLLNKDALKFRYSSKKNTFRANADEPLVIENKALGYVIRYDLKRFEFDLNANNFLYEGHARFELMSSSKKAVTDRWKKNREYAYYGSIMHFMRALWRNNLEHEKFLVRKVLPVTEEEKARVAKMYKQGLEQNNPVTTALATPDGKIKKINHEVNLDSMHYYKMVKETATGSSVIYRKVFPADSVAYRQNNQVVALDPSLKLSVVYEPKKDMYEFQKYLPALETKIVSTILATTPGKVIQITANGSYFEGADLNFIGFMAWWGKMCNKLPFDYEPDPESAPKM